MEISYCYKCKHFEDKANCLGFCKKQKININSEYLATKQACSDFGVV